MAKYKAVGLVSSRELVRQKGPEAEQALLAGLTPEEKSLYLNVIPASWLPMEDLQAKDNLLYKIARTLFPNDPFPAKTLGRSVALNQIKGVYQIFFRIPTLKFVMERVAKIYRQQWDQGELSVSGVQDRQLTVELREFPDIPPAILEVLEGFFLGVLDVLSKRNPRLLSFSPDPQLWQWILQWD